MKGNSGSLRRNRSVINGAQIGNSNTQNIYFHSGPKGSSAERRTFLTFYIAVLILILIIIVIYELSHPSRYVAAPSQASARDPRASIIETASGLRGSTLPPSESITKCGDWIESQKADFSYRACTLHDAKGSLGSIEIRNLDKLHELKRAFYWEEMARTNSGEERIGKDSNIFTIPASGYRHILSDSYRQDLWPCTFTRTAPIQPDQNPKGWATSPAVRADDGPCA